LSGAIVNPLFANLPTTIFEVMSGLARETGAINLGQGFPEDAGPEDVRRKAAEALIDGYNQYPPMLGLPELRQAIADHYRRFQGLDLDWQREVMVTSGGTEALAGAILGLIEPGDEVVLFQPMYDAYLPLVKLAGGVPKFVTLQPPHWRFSEEQLAAAFSPKTKLVLLNNPINPTATVFAREDLEMLARFVTKSDALIVSDEVWEHIVFDGRAHVSVLAIPALRERAVKIGSAGKIFSLTGWKVGFVCAAEPILKVLAKSHQFLTFTTPPNLQVAVAYGLGKDDGYFAELRAGFAAKRDRFAKGLTERGFSVLPAQGTYFLSVDIAPLGETDDVAFSQRLVREAGVATIPVSAFYDRDAVRTVLRFCFAKRDETLDEALRRLETVAIRRNS
jgi:N-succinyldiaminopimelate aminotransferase